MLGGLPVTGVIVRSSAVPYGRGLRTERPADGPHRVVAERDLSFLSVPALSRELARGARRASRVQVDLHVDYLDHAARDHLDSWAERHRATGGAVEVMETRRHGRRAARRAGGSPRSCRQLARREPAPGARPGDWSSARPGLWCVHVSPPHPLAWLEPHAARRRAAGLRRELRPRAAASPCSTSPATTTSACPATPG